MFDQSILPPTSTPIELAFELAIAKTRPDLSAIPTLMNPDTCPEHLLIWLAWAFSVDEWDDYWDGGTKREVIRQSVNIQRMKGTLTAVKEALRAGGYGTATITEGPQRFYADGILFADGEEFAGLEDHWAEYRVILENPIAVDEAPHVRRLLERTAPVHCHLKELTFELAAYRANGVIYADGTYTAGVII